MCSVEDRRGARCVLGAGHVVKCRFRPVEWTPERLAALRRLAAAPKGAGLEVFGADAQLRALAGQGFAARQFIGMRWWRYYLTLAGRRALEQAAVDVPGTPMAR
jgi:hypothetical protein